MNAKVEFQEAERNYSIKSAILIYSDGKNSAATTHDVTLRHNQPTIEPGQPITIAALEMLMKSLGRQSGVAYLPNQVVNLGLDQMAFWCPAGRRRIWFTPDNWRVDGPAKGETLDEKKMAELERRLKQATLLKWLNGRFVHHPPLLFAVGIKGGDSLSVFAMAENARPTLNTKLYKAPYWNLSGGTMCRGNLKLPSATVDSIEGFERAFFNSAFSHSSAGILTRHPGGHNGLWEELAKRKTAPDAKFWRKNLVGEGHHMKTLFKSQ
jgi:PRTRC genetic system protein B